MSGEPCTDESVVCLDAQHSRECIDGVYEEAECGELCAEFGFATGSCDEGCACEAPVNETCELAATAYCVCFEAALGEACTGQDLFTAYALCHFEEPDGLVVACFADFVDEAASTVDCEAATECLPPAP